MLSKCQSFPRPSPDLAAQRTFAEFERQCARRGLRYRRQCVAPEAGLAYGGILGRSQDYEGGFLLMCLEQVGAPAGGELAAALARLGF